jgi:integrase
MARFYICLNVHISFYYHHFCEDTKMMNNIQNLSHTNTIVNQINAETTLGTYQFRSHFPFSKKIVLLKELLLNSAADLVYIFLNHFSDQRLDHKSDVKSFIAQGGL